MKMVRLRGFRRSEIKTYERLMKKNKPIRLGALPGRWFLTNFNYETDASIYPPLSYKADFIQLAEPTKPKKRKPR